MVEVADELPNCSHNSENEPNYSPSIFVWLLLRETLQELCVNSCKGHQLLHSLILDILCALIIKLLHKNKHAYFVPSVNAMHASI